MCAAADKCSCLAQNGSAGSSVLSGCALPNISAVKTSAIAANHCNSCKPVHELSNGWRRIRVRFQSTTSPPCLAFSFWQHTPTSNCTAITVDSAPAVPAAHHKALTQLCCAALPFHCLYCAGLRLGSGLLHHKPCFEPLPDMQSTARISHRANHGPVKPLACVHTVHSRSRYYAAYSGRRCERSVLGCRVKHTGCYVQARGQLLARSSLVAE
jgi:hypothetical protein